MTIRVKPYFHIPIFTIWQVKVYRERNNFILSTTYSHAFEKCTTKTGLCNGKSYVKKLHTRL